METFIHQQKTGLMYKKAK